jgi:hypothetical protein
VVTGPGDFKMAKKSAKIKLSISAPSTPALATSAKNEEDKWRTQEDADRIKRYAELKRDSARHKAAMEHIRNEHKSVQELGADYEADEGPVEDRTVARVAKRKVSRTGSRR